MTYLLKFRPNFFCYNKNNLVCFITEQAALIVSESEDSGAPTLRYCAKAYVVSGTNSNKPIIIFHIL
jgi:hypothetical protein